MKLRHLRHFAAVGEQGNISRAARKLFLTFTAADYPEYHAWLADVFTSLKSPPQIAEEHDNATTLIAAVEAGRGVALMHEAFQCFAGPRLKIRRIIIPAVKRNGFGSLRQRSGEDAKPTPKTLRKRRLPNDRFHYRWGAGASHS